MPFQSARTRAAWTVFLAALTLAPGGHVKIIQSQDERAAEIAADIAPKLDALLTGFERERRTVKPQDVGGFLGRTENDLMGILSAPELAALRDAVKERFRQAREELREARSGWLDDRPRIGVVLAALRSPSDATGDGSALERLGQWLAQLTDLVQNQKILRDFCVVSRPRSNARVQLYPPSYPRGKVERHTQDRITLYLGLYAWKAKLNGPWIGCEPDRHGMAPADCAFLDTLSSAQPVISCDFDRESCVLASSPECP